MVILAEVSPMSVRICMHFDSKNFIPDEPVIVTYLGGRVSIGGGSVRALAKCGIRRWGLCASVAPFGASGGLFGRWVHGLRFAYPWLTSSAPSGQMRNRAIEV